MTAFEVHASGATLEASGHVDALRVLIVGSGITTGWGVQTHSLALMGSLRRALQARMERPVDIEQLSAMGTTMSRANELLGARATERWDAIVVAFGLSDAMRLTRTSSWVRATSRVLAKLDSDMPDGPLVPIAVVGIPPTDLLGALRTLLPLRALIARHAVRLNELTAQTVAPNRRAVFVPMPGMVNSSSRPTGSPEAYAAWADVIAAGLQERLAEQVSARSAEILGEDLVREAEEVLKRLAARSAEDGVERPRDPEPRPPARRRRAADRLAQPGTRRGRRSLLRTEGRALTRVPTVRAVPAESEVRVHGSDPIRVLLVGGEYSIGFGAATRADALDGALARLLHVRTGRGVIVENRAQQGVRLHQLAGSLGPAGAHTFDLVVWTPTFVEAATMLLHSRWTAGIELMLRRVETTSDAGVVLVGVPRLLGVQPLAVLGRSRAAQIGRLLRRIAARHDQVLVADAPPVVLEDVDAADGPTVYRDTAAEMLPAVLELLERRAERGRDASAMDALRSRAIEPALQ